MPGMRTVRAGGWSLILGAVAFMAVFGVLAARFDYPEILDGPAATVLPRLLATGFTGRAVWALYACLPLIWIPAGVGAYFALRRTHPASVLMGIPCTVIATISMMLGLMRWPAFHWRLAETWATADASQRVVLAAVFDGLNTYLGNYVGEFLGELAFSAFFLLTSWALFRSGAVHRAVAALGLLTSVAGLIGMFRNLTPAVAPVAAMNNYLLPLWMIVFGIVLVRWRETSAAVAR
jgi:hypothetical protein